MRAQIMWDVVENGSDSATLPTQFNIASNENP